LSLTSAIGVFDQADGRGKWDLAPDRAKTFSARRNRFAVVKSQRVVYECRGSVSSRINLN
jgi:hypothetical protein